MPTDEPDFIVATGDGEPAVAYETAWTERPADAMAIGHLLGKELLGGLTEHEKTVLLTLRNVAAAERRGMPSRCRCGTKLRTGADVAAIATATPKLTLKEADALSAKLGAQVFAAGVALCARCFPTTGNAVAQEAAASAALCQAVPGMTAMPVTFANGKWS